MLLRAYAALVLFLASVACDKDPVLGADVELSTPSATASAPPPPSASSTAMRSRPLIQQMVVAVPACPPDAPRRPRLRIPGCKQEGNVVCWRYTERSQFDENDAVAALRTSMTACLRPSLLPSSVVWASLGILPNGRVCGPSFMSSEALPPQGLECIARRLNAYRASVADTRSSLTFKVAFPVGAPVVLQETPL